MSHDISAYPITVESASEHEIAGQSILPISIDWYIELERDGCISYYICYIIASSCLNVYSRIEQAQQTVVKKF